MTCQRAISLYAVVSQARDTLCCNLCTCCMTKQHCIVSFALGEKPAKYKETAQNLREFVCCFFLRTIGFATIVETIQCNKEKAALRMKTKKIINATNDREKGMKEKEN